LFLRPVFRRYPSNRYDPQQDPSVSVSIAEFWKLLAQSRLLSPEQCRQLEADFGQVKGAAAQGNAKTVAQWCTARNILTEYQATIFLAGRHGPFFFGDYKVYDRVDRGRLSGQFRAVHAATGHPVLLQFLTGPWSKDPAAWAAAAAELRAAAAIRSPHVQRWFEPVDVQSFKFLVSEDLRGQSLAERVASGRLPPAEACRVVRLAALGLAQMHAHSRIHGDVRPENLLLESLAGGPDNVKVLLAPHEVPAPVDLAQLASTPEGLARLDYLAPELATPGKAPDTLTDTYALGCTLYTLLAGMPPFAGGQWQQKMARHATEPIRPLESFGVPPAVGQVVAFMMAKNPAVRFPSLAVVAEQLLPLVDPAARHEAHPQPPPTLASFERALVQRRTQPASASAAGGASRGSSALPGFKLDVGDAGSSRAASGTGGTSAATAAALKSRKEAQQRKTLVIGLGAAALLVVGAIVGVNMMGNGGSPKPGPGPQIADAGDPEPIPRIEPTPAGNGSAKSGTTANTGTSTGSPTQPSQQTPAAPAAVLAQEIVPDDGTLLWASPTAGAPVNLRLVPPAAEMFLIVRPAELLATGEGEKLLAALGPDFSTARAAFEQAAGVPLAEIEELIVAFHNNDAQFPRLSYVVRTAAAIPPADLVARWGNPATAKTESGASLYAGDKRAYYVGTAPQDARSFVFGDVRDIQEVAKVAGNPPTLRREMARLAKTLDADRHATLLVYPPFLWNDDGEPLFAGDRRRLREPLSWLLGDGLLAAAVSMHQGDALYAEARLIGSLDQPPRELSAGFRERLGQVPTGIEDYVVQLSPPPYWKKLAFRFPGMVRALDANLRVGVEEDQAIINCILPPGAAHNLLLGAELAVATAPGPTIAAAEPPAGPKTIDEVLAVKTTYTFDSQSLEFAMRDLAIDVQDKIKGSPIAFEIRIIGADLEKDGITRNQTIRDFKQEDRPVADILTALVMKANPITTVKDPSETDQKLIWVVGPDPDNPAKQIILITTRAAAATKNYKLPAPFLGSAGG
jgi:eukaryotic-like serine/threonine-protein kinase